MSVENPSLLYVAQTLTDDQKARACLNIGAQPTVAGKGLSSNDYTDAEKLKLSGIDADAEENVIESITVNGSAVQPDVTKNVAITIADVPTVTSNDDGKVLKASYSGGTGSYSWETETGTTYAAGNGIAIDSSNNISVKIPSSNAGLEFDSNGVLDVKTSTANGIKKGASGLEVRLATSSGLELSSGLKVKTDGTTIQVNSSGELEAIGGGGTTYTAGDGIDIASSTIKANIDTAAGLKFDSSSPKKIQINTGTNISFNATSGALDVPTVSASTGGTGGTNGVMLATDKEKLDNATVAVKLEGAVASLTPSSGVATIPNAVATGETGATNGLMTADDKKSLGTAVQCKVNPTESGTPVLLAQQIYVVESDAEIVTIATNPSEINGKGTLFFRIGTAVT